MDGNLSEERAAIAAVEGFLATFGLSGGEHRDRLVRHALVRARGRYSAGVDLAGRAVRAARADLEAWAAFVLGDAADGSAPLSRIRAAYLRCAGPVAWPEALCCYDLGDACVHALRQAAPPKLPPEAPSPMPPQALERWSMAALARPGRERSEGASEADASTASAG